MKHGYRVSPGFTLLEALVSISIIAVLAALGYVGMGKIRESANQVKCLTNLRQIGLGMTYYLQENRMVYPLSYSSSGLDWRFALVRGGYLGEPDFNSSEDQTRWRPEWFQVMGCPQARRISSVDRPYSPTYAMNSSIGSGTISHLRFQDPSSVWLVTEGKKAASGRWVINAWPNAGDNSHPSKIHGASANVLFADTHIETMKVKEFPSSSAPTGSKNWIFWHGRPEL